MLDWIYTAEMNGGFYGWLLKAWGVFECMRVYAVFKNERTIIVNVHAHGVEPIIKWKAPVSDYLLSVPSGKWMRERSVFHINACTSPQRCMILCRHPYGSVFMCMCIRVFWGLRLKIYLFLKHTLMQTTSCIVDIIVHMLACVPCMLPEDATSGHIRELRPWRTAGFAGCKQQTWGHSRSLVLGQQQHHYRWYVRPLNSAHIDNGKCVSLILPMRETDDEKHHQYSLTV